MANIENQKWIEIKLAVLTVASSIIKAKKQMEEYAKELNWIVITDKKGEVDETEQDITK
jgi:hypothetical protein